MVTVLQIGGIWRYHGEQHSYAKSKENIYVKLLGQMNQDAHLANLQEALEPYEGGEAPSLGRDAVRQQASVRTTA